MYIEKYWGNYIGGTDDSLTLLDYLTGKGKREITLGEILADTGLDRLNWDFRTTGDALQYTDPDGTEHAFDYAADVVTDLAALMLECRISGSVSLGRLLDNQDGHMLRITATPEELNALRNALTDFCANPLTYDLHEMVPDEDMQALAQDCSALCAELFA